MLYNTLLIGLLDKHAPLKTRTITIRPLAPWYTEDIREEKQKRRALERRWRRTGLTVDRERFVEQCHVVMNLFCRQKGPIIRGLLTRTNMIPNACSPFLTSFFIVIVILNYLILWMISSLQMRLLIISLKRSSQFAKSCRIKGVLQTTPKLSYRTAALSLITSSQYHVMNCLIWSLDRL